MLIGNNKLRACPAVVMRAVEWWLNNRVLHMPVRVSDASLKGDLLSIRFTNGLPNGGGICHLKTLEIEPLVAIQEWLNEVVLHAPVQVMKVYESEGAFVIDLYATEPNPEER